MEHVAIDLGGRESQICVRAANGSIVEEQRRATKKLREYLAERPAVLVTVFLIRTSRGAKAAKELLGESFLGILTTDRWASYNWSRRSCGSSVGAT